MTPKRLWQTIRLYTIRGNRRRTEYMRKKGIFASIGENCSIMKRKPPLNANLIRIGNNVHIASGVSFLTHDITHSVLNNLEQVKARGKVQERVGCIEIGDNVFVGAGTRILYDTKIGSNVVIGTGSVVTKDIPDNSVAAGVPARVIGSFDGYVEKMLSAEDYPSGMRPGKQVVSPELAAYLWERFDRDHAQTQDRPLQ